MGHSVATDDNKGRIVTTRAAMIFALIIVGLLIATANFIQVMGHSDDHGAGHGDGHATEAHHDAHDTDAGHSTYEVKDKVHAPTQGNTAPKTDAPSETTPEEHAEAGAEEAAQH